MHMRIASNFVSWILFSCLAVPVASSSQSARTTRYGDTPIIRSWIALYECPSSAKRLPPVLVWPVAGDFDKAQACAVAWRARAIWIKSTNLVGTVIDPGDSLALTQIVVDHPHMLHIPDGGDEKDAKPVTGFSVELFRGPRKPSIIVGFGRNTDFLEIGWGHPGPFPPITSSCCGRSTERFRHRT
jgi:hypothetical protein